MMPLIHYTNILPGPPSRAIVTIVPGFKGRGGGQGAETGHPPRWHADRLVRPKLLGEGEGSGTIPGGHGAGPQDGERRSTYPGVFEPSDWVQRRLNWVNERCRNIVSGILEVMNPNIPGGAKGRSKLCVCVANETHHGKL